MKKKEMHICCRYNSFSSVSAKTTFRQRKKSLWDKDRRNGRFKGIKNGQLLRSTKVVKVLVKIIAHAGSYFSHFLRWRFKSCFRLYEFSQLSHLNCLSLWTTGPIYICLKNYILQFYRLYKMRKYTFGLWRLRLLYTLWISIRWSLMADFCENRVSHFWQFWTILALELFLGCFEIGAVI